MLLSIEKLVYGGDGIARTPSGSDGRSMAVFLPFVLPGERVEAEIRQEKPGFARGSVTQLIDASPDRIEARCPYFRQCGGCHYQHIPYERQLKFKAEILRESLQRIAKIELKSEIRLHASPPWNYRNRTRLQVRTVPDFALGYFRLNSHEFLAVHECPISSPLINRVMAQLLELRGLDCPAGVEELELFADAADEHLLAWAFVNQACHPERNEGSPVHSGREAAHRDLLRWAEAIERELPEVSGVTFFPSRHWTSTGRLSLGQSSPRRSSPRQSQVRRSSQEGDQDNILADAKPLAQSGAKSIRYRTRNHEYQVSAGAFFQVNSYLIDDLISVVTGNASGDAALDLYTGGGLFSAALAENFHHIFAVEASQTSYVDLVQNVPANVKAVGAPAGEYLMSDYLKRRPVRQPDLIVLDPPRSGVGKSVINSLLQLGAPRVRYVSCDPATLARDIAPLLAAGYRIEEVHLFDLFPQTFHIESVMLLAR
jgi:23S rRNA (uracil1939-C5)-methyltransferase